MSLIEWSDDFKVGVLAVDREHRELIRRINSSYDALVKEDCFADSAQVFLVNIYESVSAHFASEEAAMYVSRYDEYIDHKAEHTRLLDEIVDTRKNIKNQSYYTANILSQQLSVWFGNHFKTRDARLHHYLNAAGAHGSVASAKRF